MKRHLKATTTLLTFMLLFVSGLSRASGQGNDEPADRPNIVLIMADDQGWGDMAYNGHPVLKTPNFDAAAAAGLRFDRFYAAAPVCSPTRASVMTGRHPNRMGVFKWGFPMRPQEETIAEVLKSNGYATGHFGKWHLGSVRNTSPANPGNNGFDYWLSAPNFYDNDPILSQMGKAVQHEGESSIIVANDALSWIDRQTARDASFFAVVWFGSPHSPHRATPEFKELYKDQDEKVQDFYGEISGMDKAFGIIRDGLSKRGLSENTILWYCSDNGALPRVGATGGFRGNKGKVYEGGLLVPSIVEWPTVIKRPVQSAARCNTSDIFPTLLDLVGIESSASHPLDGVSLAELIHTKRGLQKQREKPMGFWDYTIGGISTPAAKWMSELWEAQQKGNDLPPHPSSVNAAKLPNPAFASDSFPGHSAWINGNWKMHRIENKQGEVSWELYNLQDDPNETTDVIVGHSDTAKSLQAELTEWLASVVDSINGKDYETN
ncbi:MAG: sulfatase-like hydrolase/transferase [Pirellulaceae bacterium]